MLHLVNRHVHRHFHVGPFVFAIGLMIATAIAIWGCQGPSSYMDSSTLHPVTAGERAATFAAKTAGTVAGIAPVASVIPGVAEIAAPAGVAAAGYSQGVTADVAQVRAEFERALQDGLAKHLAAMQVAATPTAQSAEQSRWEQWRKDALSAEDRRMWLAAITAGVGAVAGVIAKRHAPQDPPKESTT